MERKKQFSDPLDQLIVDTLNDEMGPGPSNDVWLRIAKEINHSAAPTSSEEPPSVEEGWLFLFLAQPFLQRSAALFLLMIIIINIYVMN